MKLCQFRKKYKSFDGLSVHLSTPPTTLRILSDDIKMATTTLQNPKDIYEKYELRHIPLESEIRKEHVGILI